MKPGAADWQKGQEGMTLGVGYKIKTPAGGNATLTFFEGTTIELSADTEIGLAELSTIGKVNTIKMTETIGQTISRVKKLTDPASNYEIETKACVAAVRGTTMYVAVDKNGKTTVGNIEGSAFVIVNGVETDITPGQQLMVEPGKPAGAQQPLAIPGTSTTSPAAGKPVTTPAGQTSSTTASVLPDISISTSVDKPLVFNGDTVTITYNVTNKGTIPVSGVAVNDTGAGLAVYTGGDKNTNKQLDPGETWNFTAKYTIPDSASTLLMPTAIASAKSADNQDATAITLTRINIAVLTVNITSPNANTPVSSSMTLAGNVNDPSVTNVIIDINGTQTKIPVINGSFSTTVTLTGGVNTITVTAVNARGISANASIVLEPASSSAPPPSNPDQGPSHP
jgi:hypothetical protein